MDISSSAVVADDAGDPLAYPFLHKID